MYDSANPSAFSFDVQVFDRRRSDSRKTYLAELRGYLRDVRARLSDRRVTMDCVSQDPLIAPLLNSDLSIAGARHEFPCQVPS